MFKLIEPAREGISLKLYYDILSNIKCDKILVEFLRINNWIEKWFGDYININDYILKEGNYKHLPLDRKIELINKIKGFKERKPAKIAKKDIIINNVL